MDEIPRSRAAAFIRHPMLKAFVTESTSSTALLVNGNEDLSSAEGLSPFGLVAARLARISEQTETKQNLTLRYFCAEHGPYSGEHQASSPAASMMSSLTGQLVSHMLSRSITIDLSFMEAGNLGALKKQNLRVICTLFYELVKQLPSKTIVLCMLDELAIYESRVSQGDLDVAVRRLVRLVEGCDNVVLKLLVTCRGRASGIGQYFVGHTLELEEDVEVNDSATWHIASMG